MTDALRGAVVAALNAVLVCLQAFAVNVTDDQQVAITGAVNALLVVWLIWRHKTKPAI